MAARPQDEESLLTSDRESKDLPRGSGKERRWQRGYCSPFNLNGVRTSIATMAVLTIFLISLWMLCVPHSCLWRFQTLTA